MGTFAEAYPRVADAMGHAGPSSTATSYDAHDPFAAILQVVLHGPNSLASRSTALDALDEAGLLEPEALAEADGMEVEAVLPQSTPGGPAKAAAQLRRVARWVVDRHHGSAHELRDPAIATSQLREELAALRGIGPATADEILLFALGRPRYPVNRASDRVLVRHGWLDPSAGYDEAQEILEQPCEQSALAMVDLWSTLSRLGREFCRVGKPSCDDCPLRPLLPEQGPIEPDT